MAADPKVGRAVATDVSSRTTHQLYEQYGKQIYAYCLHRLRSKEEAEDAVQTTFLNAFRALQKGTQTQFEQAWLFKIASNVCLERAQTSGRRLRVESPSDLQIIQETASAHMPQDPEQLIGIEDALATMPANQRKAILLREWQGLSYREIGEELHLSQAAVEMLIFRARRTLAIALEQPETTSKKRKTGGIGLNIGSLVAALKTLFTGGAAVKAVAVAVTAGAVAITSAKPVLHDMLHQSTKPKAAPPIVQPVQVVRPVPAAHVAARKPKKHQPVAHTPARVSQVNVVTHAAPRAPTRVQPAPAKAPAIDEQSTSPASVPTSGTATPAAPATPAPTKPTGTANPTDTPTPTSGSDQPSAPSPPQTSGGGSGSGSGGHAPKGHKDPGSGQDQGSPGHHDGGGSDGQYGYGSGQDQGGRGQRGGDDPAGSGATSTGDQSGQPTDPSSDPTGTGQTGDGSTGDGSTGQTTDGGGSGDTGSGSTGSGTTGSGSTGQTGGSSGSGDGSGDPGQGYGTGGQGDGGGHGRSR